MGLSTKIGLAALATAVTQLGVKENPPGSNSGPTVNEYLKSTDLSPGYPWCQAFLRWCFKKNGRDIGGGASVGNFLAWGRANGDVVTRPFAGDVVCYNFTADNWPDHVGIVEKVLSIRGVGIARVIEGNTALGNDADGGQVQRRTRRLGRCKFVRIKDK